VAYPGWYQATLADNAYIARAQKNKVSVLLIYILNQSFLNGSNGWMQEAHDDAGWYKSDRWLLLIFNVPGEGA